MTFTENNIFLDLNVTSKEELFSILSNHACKNHYVKDSKQTIAAFIERENEFSTGLQDGFAIPHAKDESVINATVFFARLTSPIEWETFDDNNVQYVFALFVPKNEAETTHIQMLSKLAIALMDDEFKQQIKITKDKNQLISLINKEMTREVSK